MKVKLLLTLYRIICIIIKYKLFIYKISIHNRGGMMAKRTKKPINSAIKIGIAPTQERYNRNGGLRMEIMDRDARGKVLMRRYRAVWECPLDAYLDHRVITEPEHRAGTRFRHAYHRAVLSRRAIAERLNRYPTTEGLTMNEKLIKDAYDTISPHNMGTVIDVCGHDRVIWGPQALESLRKGLGHLALKWHMTAIEVCEHKPK
jgi:hypothetical protein